MVNGRQQCAHVILLLCGFHFCLSAGLCDINEGTAVPEDRCKSPTSGNLFLYFINNSDSIKRKVAYQCTFAKESI